jgi:prephenate dehydrogenase
VRLAILGLGLIGGSIARAVRERAPGEPGDGWSIAAWSPSGVGPAAAAAAGAIDAAPANMAETVVGADLVVLAAPPLACLGMLDALASPEVRLDDAVLTDVASTKEAIVARATDRGLPFVGGHPMAGSDRSGWAAASADLFADRPWVVAPLPDAPAEAVERVEALARRCGAVPVRMAAADHDRAVAAVSHLPLLLSVALVEAVGAGADREDVLRLAASGWRDMTRLAHGDVEMSTGIAATNARNLAGRVREARVALDQWIEELEREGGPDIDSLRERFVTVRDALAGD